MSNFLDRADFRTQVALGLSTDVIRIVQTGFNVDIDADEDIWEAPTALFVAPTAARTHGVTSGNAADVGSSLVASTVTGGDAYTLIDTDGDFVSNSVVAGAIVANDTKGTFGYVKAVLSESTLTLTGVMTDGMEIPWGIENDIGDTYRILTDSGTGAGVLYVFGLDENFAFKGETLLLVGASTVTTQNSYVMIHEMRVLAVGSNGGPVANIAATATTNSTVTAQVNIGNNKTEMAIFMVPDGYWAMLNRSFGSQVATVVTAHSLNILVDSPNGTQSTVIRNQVNPTIDNIMNNPFEMGPVFPPRSLIRMRTSMTVASGSVFGGFELLLHKAR